MIVKIEQNPNGSHNNQSNTPKIIPEGWIEVPFYLESLFNASNSFCDLIIENGILVDITAIEKPEPEPPSIDEQINELKALLASTDYQAIKYAEGLITEEDYAPIKAQRQEWRDEINRLEALQNE